MAKLPHAITTHGDSQDDQNIATVSLYKLPNPSTLGSSAHLADYVASCSVQLLANSWYAPLNEPNDLRLVFSRMFQIELLPEGSVRLPDSFIDTREDCEISFNADQRVFKLCFSQLEG